MTEKQNNKTVKSAARSLLTQSGLLCALKAGGIFSLGFGLAIAGFTTLAGIAGFIFGASNTDIEAFASSVAQSSSHEITGAVFTLRSFLIHEIIRFAAIVVVCGLVAGCLWQIAKEARKLNNLAISHE